MNGHGRNDFTRGSVDRCHLVTTEFRGVVTGKWGGYPVKERGYGTIPYCTRPHMDGTSQGVLKKEKPEEV